MWKIPILARFGLAFFALAAECLGQTTPSNPTAELLAQLIRIDSRNPPGNDVRVAEFLTTLLTPLGFQTEMLPTPVPGKVHFFARLKGNGRKRPILLAAHADVVGVERSGWHIEPFGGIQEQGYVYGRGAIDDKGSLAVFTQALIRLAKSKIPLERDIVLLSEADEESGSYGAEWLAEKYFSKIDCAAVLNEGGWIIQNSDLSVAYMSVSTTDKISVWLKLTAHGITRHSSLPGPDSAIFELATALSKLANYRTKVQLISSTRQFFRTLAKVSEPSKSEQFDYLLNSTSPDQAAAAEQEISKDPLLNAVSVTRLPRFFSMRGFVAMSYQGRPKLESTSVFFREPTSTTSSMKSGLSLKIPTSMSPSRVVQFLRRKMMSNHYERLSKH